MATLTRDRAYFPAVSADYDPDADVLYISLGEPVPAEGKYVNGVIYRYSMKDGTPCGVTVVSYLSEKWNSKIEELAKLVAEYLPTTKEDVIRTIRETVPS